MIVCSLCKNRLDNPEIIGNYVYGGVPQQKFYRCSVCDVAFLYPQMGPKDEQRFYASEFEKFMEERSTGANFDWSGPAAHIKSNEKQFLRRLPFFKDLLMPGKRVLEIGCSSGFMLLPLKEKGYYVVGVEPSKGFTGFLKERGIPAYESLAKISRMQKKTAFDLVLHFFVLEHVRDPVVFLKDALECVVKGGHMVFEVPNRNDPLLTIYNIEAFHKFYWSVAHNYYFNRPSLEYLVKQVAENFEIINEQRYDLSNHITWALTGKPGGQGKYSAYFTPELEAEYRQSMVKTGYCDTLFCRVKKE